MDSFLVAAMSLRVGGVSQPAIHTEDLADGSGELVRFEREAILADLRRGPLYRRYSG